MTSAESPYGDLVDTTLRAMTWNVWGRFGPWEQRERAITAVLRASAPDIVLLQECWCDDAGANQAARLGELLDMHHCFSGGNAILSRWPTTDVREHALPALDTAGWGGLALRAVIEGPRRSVLVYCVALDCPPAAFKNYPHSWWPRFAPRSKRSSKPMRCY